MILVWMLSPAFDLLPSDGFNGFHTTTIAGQGDPKFSDIEKVAETLKLNVKRCREIYDLVKEKCRL